MYACFFGDSLTLGTNDRDCLGWPGRLCARAAARGTPVDFYNLGVRGQTSAEIKERWIDEAAVRLSVDEATAAIFCFGVADTAKGVEPDETLKNARAMLHIAAKTYDAAIMVSPFPVGDEDVSARIGELSRSLKGVCTDLDIPFLDVYTPLSESHAYESALAAGGDGIHPREGGYEVVAELVDGWQAWRKLE